MNNFERLSSTLPFATVVLMGLTVFLMIWHWKVMKKANELTALTAIISILQAKEVRKARGCLMNFSKKAFSKWEPVEKNKAALVCSTFDTVGILVKAKVTNHELVTAPWRHSLVECWKNAKPMIDAYREKRGDDFWEHFCWLAEKADPKEIEC